MIRRLILALLLIGAPAVGALAWIAQAPSGGGGAPSCTANITGSGTATAILTGTATALANLTCQ